jgi:choline dehydrogenase-like flavoprotein
MADEMFDVCVIGTGAGGGVMIDQLTAAGLRVVALERGPYLETSEFDDDELRNVVRDQVFSRDQLETFRQDGGAKAEVGHYSQIAHCVGGTLTHWAAWSWRFREDEFKVLSTEGSVAGASLADWPFGYDELAPFYERAEWDFGVSGDATGNPFAAPRGKGFPNPPHPQRPGSVRFAEGAKGVGYQPFPVPMAINSKPYAGRPSCMNGGACRSYGCPVHAKGTTYSVSLPRARRTGKLDLRADAMVFEVPVDDAGRAIGARYFDSSGATHEVRARQVVLSGGTMGTPHLLLMSKSSSFADGLANGSGLVGKNLTFHHHPSVVGVFEDDMRGYTGVEAGMAFDDLHPSDPKRGFIRGGVVAETNTFTHQPLAFASTLGEYNKPQAWGADLKSWIREFPRASTYAGICEELPIEACAVDLDPDVKDRFGLPVRRITKHQHENDLAMFDWYEEKLVAVAEAAGATRVLRGSQGPLTISKDISQSGNAHNHGTCRMGTDPAKSVVDGYGRSHEVPNLWIVDGSTMPTNGGYNPTLTILATAYRSADHFVSEARKGNL